MLNLHKANTHKAVQTSMYNSVILLQVVESIHSLQHTTTNNWYLLFSSVQLHNLCFTQSHNKNYDSWADTYNYNYN